MGGEAGGERRLAYTAFVRKSKRNSLEGQSGHRNRPPWLVQPPGGPPAWGNEPRLTQALPGVAKAPVCPGRYVSRNERFCVLKPRKGRAKQDGWSLPPSPAPLCSHLLAQKREVAQVEHFQEYS